MIFFIFIIDGTWDFSSRFFSFTRDTFISFVPTQDPSWYPFDDFHSKHLVFEAFTNLYLSKCTSPLRFILVISFGWIRVTLLASNKSYYRSRQLISLSQPSIIMTSLISNVRIYHILRGIGVFRLYKGWALVMWGMVFLRV